MRRGPNTLNKRAMGAETITIRDTEAFKRYLTEVSNIKQFPSNKAEQECAIRAYKAEDDDTVDSPLIQSIRLKAREELVRRNLRFVISVAKQYVVDGVSLEDLVNEGNYGLIRASKQFDPTRGLKFISYSVWWIRNKILVYLSEYSRTIRLPINRVDGIKKYKTRIGIMEQTLQRKPTIDEYLEKYDDSTNTDVEAIEALIDSDIRSLDMTLGEDGNTMYDILEDTSSEQADSLIEVDDIKESFDVMLGELDDRELLVITKMHGLNGESKSTLEDIGDELGMSRENVRNIETKVFRFLKEKYKHSSYNYFEIM